MKTFLLSVWLLSAGFVASQNAEADPQDAQRADGDYSQAWDEVMKDYGTERWDARLDEFLEGLTHDEFNRWSQVHYTLLGDKFATVDSETTETQRGELR